jgi:hypothetical protein
MDQLCINQKEGEGQHGHREREQEVPKMGQYYSNAMITLISIHAKIGEKIINDLSESLKKRENELIYPNKVVNSSLPILKKIIDSE